MVAQLAVWQELHLQQSSTIICESSEGFGRVTMIGRLRVPVEPCLALAAMALAKRGKTTVNRLNTSMWGTFWTLLDFEMLIFFVSSCWHDPETDAETLTLQRANLKG